MQLLRPLLLAAVCLGAAHAVDNQGTDKAWFTRACVAAGGNECWQSTGLTHGRLSVMCGLSGGSGYPVVKKSCAELGFKCKYKFGESSVAGFILSLGMSFKVKCPEDKAAPKAVAHEGEDAVKKIRAADPDAAEGEKPTAAGAGEATAGLRGKQQV